MIIWDEYKYGEKVYFEGVQTKHWQEKELHSLAQYLLFEGFDEYDISDEMNMCCIGKVKDLSEDDRYAFFYSMQCRAMKHNIIKDRKITLYKSELDAITALNDVGMERVAFIYLVYSKWFNSKWFEMLKVDLKREAKITGYNSERLKRILNQLDEKGLFESDMIPFKYNETQGVYEPRMPFSGYNIDKGVSETYRIDSKRDKLEILHPSKRFQSVTFLATSGEVAFEIDNYINVVYKYLNYKDGGYFECKKCGGMVKRTNNRHTYCDECKKYIPMNIKWIKCEDCGKEVEVSAKANNRKRCDACTLEAKRKAKRKWARRNAK